MSEETESGAVGAAEVVIRMLSNGELAEAYRNAKAADGEVADRAAKLMGKEIIRRTMGRSPERQAQGLGGGRWDKAPNSEPASKTSDERL